MISEFYLGFTSSIIEMEGSVVRMGIIDIGNMEIGERKNVHTSSKRQASR